MVTGALVVPQPREKLPMPELPLRRISVTNFDDGERKFRNSRQKHARLATRAIRGTPGGQDLVRQSSSGALDGVVTW